MSDVPSPGELDNTRKIMVEHLATDEASDLIKKSIALNFKLLELHFVQTSTPGLNSKRGPDVSVFTLSYSRSAISLPEDLIGKDISMNLTINSHTGKCHLWVGVIPANGHNPSMVKDSLAFDEIIPTINEWLEKILSSL